MKKAKVALHKNLPTPQKISDALKLHKLVCVYDQNLLRYPHLAQWIASFENGFSVVAGEDLKDLKNFPPLIEKLAKAIEGVDRHKVGLAVIGGGTVGDTFGFAASVLKRGIPYFSLPSTWLAALDSAHGGKTALNVGPFKNQVGSFYPPQEIWVCQALLATQSLEQRQSAFGELAKMALLTGGSLFKKLHSAKDIDQDLMWSLLPLVIKAKNEFVRKDPFEKKGLRYALNLGHTFGHALELFHQVPHGKAVHLGLWFAVEWGRHLGLVTKRDYEQMTKTLRYRPQLDFKVNLAQLSEAFRHDKKVLKDDLVRFVFVKKPGDFQIRPVAIGDLVLEAKRQGWAQ